MYEDYCTKMKMKPVDKKEFTVRLRDHFGITTGKRFSGTLCVYVGIGLVEETGNAK